MRGATRALSDVVGAKRRLAGLLQRSQASLAARQVSQPELPPFAHEPMQYRGPSKQDVIDLRKRYLNPGGLGHKDSLHKQGKRPLSAFLVVQQFLPGTKIQS